MLPRNLLYVFICYLHISLRRIEFSNRKKFLNGRNNEKHVICFRNLTLRFNSFRRIKKKKKKKMKKKKTKKKNPKKVIAP